MLYVSLYFLNDPEDIREAARAVNATLMRLVGAEDDWTSGQALKGVSSFWLLFGLFHVLLLVNINLSYFYRK